MMNKNLNLICVFLLSLMSPLAFSAGDSTRVYLPAFYESVMKMAPNGKLGQIIKMESISTSVQGAQAWRIAFISSDFADKKTISTGILVAPIGSAPKGGRPVVAWAHGTTGTAQNCGPSQLPNPVELAFCESRKGVTLEPFVLNSQAASRSHALLLKEGLY